VRIVKLEQKVMKTPLRSRGQRMDYWSHGWCWNEKSIPTNHGN
jgi:hypothetical protein